MTSLNSDCCITTGCVSAGRVAQLESKVESMQAEMNAMAQHMAELEAIVRELQSRESDAAACLSMRVVDGLQLLNEGCLGQPR